MSLMIEEKLVIVIVLFNEVNVIGLIWVQEVSDIVKGLKDWEIVCEFSGGYFCKYYC